MKRGARASMPRDIFPVRCTRVSTAIYPVKTPGHIPGAANHFFQWNLDERGTFRSADDLRERLQRSIGDVPADRLVCYCGSGVTACHNLLALEHAGLIGAKLYSGSWSEWSSDPSRPIEKGDGHITKTQRTP